MRHAIYGFGVIYGFTALFSFGRRLHVWEVKLTSAKRSNNDLPKQESSKTSDLFTMKMSVIYILTRVDAICNKYEKYDIDKQKENQISGNDAFVRLYTVVEADIEAAKQKADDAAKEKNRAVVVTLNAEIRRTKARLHEEIPKLQKVAQKKVKGLSKEDIVTRNDLVPALADKIDSIPDGTNTGTGRTAAWNLSSSDRSLKCGERNRIKD